MNTFFEIIIVLVFVISGIYSFATGKIDGNMAKNYTKESARKFAKVFGIAEALLGLSIGVKYLIEYLSHTEFSLVQNLIFYGIAVVIFLIVTLIAQKKMLVKLDQPANTDTPARREPAVSDDDTDTDEDDR